MIKYSIFLRLFKQAQEYDSLELYIAERGWEGWMEPFYNNGSVDGAVEVLTQVYTLARQSFSEMRVAAELSRAELSRIYNIPYRTLEAWETGQNEPAFYLKVMYAYAIFSELLTNGGNSNGSPDE